jgi:hypothetical protein
VLDASPEHAQQSQWFDPLYRDLENGGREEFLWLLLNLNLQRWHPRNLPKTAESIEQQRFSADSVAQWAQACIDADGIIGEKGMSHSPLNQPVATHILYEAYKAHCKYHPVSNNVFGKALTEMFGPPSRQMVVGAASRPRTYRVSDAHTWQRVLNARLGI